MLQDGSGLVLLDSLGHHVQDVVHYCCTQLQVKVGLHTLLGHSLGHTLGVTSCWKNPKLSSLYKMTCKSLEKTTTENQISVHTLKLSG